MALLGYVIYDSAKGFVSEALFVNKPCIPTVTFRSIGSSPVECYPTELLYTQEVDPGTVVWGSIKNAKLFHTEEECRKVIESIGNKFYVTESIVELHFDEGKYHTKNLYH